MDRNSYPEYSNEQRGERIAKLLFHYADSGEPDRSISAEDLAKQDPADIAYALADILHWCDKNMPFSEVLDWAREHHEEEKRA